MYIPNSSHIKTKEINELIKVVEKDIIEWQEVGVREKKTEW